MKTLDTREKNKSIIDVLAQHSFLKELSPHYLQFVAEGASQVSFDPGEEILHEGAEANQFYLIQDGKVALGISNTGRGFTTIQSLGAGEILGWSWLMPPHYWHFGAKAITPIQAIALDGKRLRDKCEEDHDFGYELIKRLGLIIGQRLRATRIRLNE